MGAAGVQRDWEKDGERAGEIRHRGGAGECGGCSAGNLLGTGQDLYPSQKNPPGHNHSAVFPQNATGSACGPGPPHARGGGREQ